MFQACFKTKAPRRTTTLDVRSRLTPEPPSDFFRRVGGVLSFVQISGLKLKALRYIYIYIYVCRYVYMYVCR